VANPVRNARPNSPTHLNSTLNRPMASQGGTRYEDRTMGRAAHQPHNNGAVQQQSQQYHVNKTIFCYTVPVLRIRDTLGRIRIRGSVTLTNGSGSGFPSWRHMDKKMLFFVKKSFFFFLVRKILQFFVIKTLIRILTHLKC
jgi:hypothetical protein